MNFPESIQICFQKFADFNGRAKRPEFWWFFLFCVLVSLALERVSSNVSWLFSIVVLIPGLAVGSRRLHDTNKSGWFQLLWLIPVLGWVAMIYLQAQEGDAEANQFGEPTAN